MGRPKKNNSNLQKHLSLRSSGSEDALTKTIIYLQSQPDNTQELAATTLNARFLPFALDVNDPEFKKIALRCAVTCESWGMLIREYAGLGYNKSIHPVATETKPKVVAINKEQKKPTKSSQKNNALADKMGFNF